MAANANQHFLPQCYLRAFSDGAEGRSVSLYRLSTDTIVSNASIRGQCSRRYFYGKDLSLEKAFQPIEAEYARVRDLIVSGAEIRSEDVNFLRYFIAIQYCRTEIAAKRIFSSQDEMASIVFRNEEERKKYGNFGEKEALMISMAHAGEMGNIIDDLGFCIIQNDTDFQFITSDDPVIRCNRYYQQRLRDKWGGSGFIHSGECIYLPISPKYLILFYDPFVYRIGRRTQKFAISRKMQADSLNCLQVIKANQNLYFSTTQKDDYVQELAAANKAYRPKSWHTINYAVLDNKDEFGTSYRTISKEEVGSIEHSEALVHLHKKPLVPPIWFGDLSYRLRPQTHDTKSGLGYIRPSRRGWRV
ncbi:DUF4238 domain-containing protein [Pelagibacterium limicola]|uniref:DUF4238 domain-containing protein n=1 Tax=Pelagibacterium limicola TaxID=2791022 RepID=UPI0018AF97AB|nr:DUF4238 domain-containing protein [Pelagibacterium limicola]